MWYGQGSSPFQMKWIVFISWLGFKVGASNSVYNVYVGTSFKKFK
jgi:hypothetical protein